MQRQRFRLEFEKHRGFLAQEEQLQLRRLEEEERATLQKLRDSKNKLVQQNKALKELAEELEERSQRPALWLLEVRHISGGGGRCEANGQSRVLTPRMLALSKSVKTDIEGVRIKGDPRRGPITLYAYQKKL